MKKNTTITALLGVTQHDMATLLGVSRSQWSMYELGKRDLPLAAQQLLAAMLVYVNAPEATTNSLPPAVRQQVTKKQLERLLHENEYQQMLVAKKIDAITKKRETQLRQLRLQEYLIANDPENANTRFSFTLPNGMFAISEEESTAQLVTLQLKQQVLVFEKGLIEARLENR